MYRSTQLTKTSGPVSVLASNGRRVVVGVVNDLACVYDRWTGELLRAFPSDWSADVLIDGDTVYLVAGATGVLTAFGIVDGLARPCVSVSHARGVRRWTDGGGPGHVVGRFADTFPTFGPQPLHAAECRVGPTASRRAPGLAGRPKPSARSTQRIASRQSSDCSKSSMHSTCEGRRS